MTLVDKRIAVGVCGGIAAYKACELIRSLKKAGSEVRVVMTESAQKFVSELTFATLSENPVSGSLFEGQESTTAHIDVARWAEAVVVCPATANVIAKTAVGIADDLLSTTILATRARVVFCPAMNSVMWEKAVVQENVRKLGAAGYDLVPPEFGALATAAEGEGWGRLADISHIVEKLRSVLCATGELAGKKVLVTAGATREPVDPVRYFTNYATGKMGFALAEAAKLRGGSVVLVSGPNHLPKLTGVKYIEIETVAELKAAVEQEYPDCDLLLMAAAVSDYRPKKNLPTKLKKTAREISITMQKNPDILASLGRRKAHCFHVGFALETENEIANAMQKMSRKNLDMIVLNNPLQPGAAFGGDTNIVTIIAKDGRTERLPLQSKTEVADTILHNVCSSMNATLKHVAAV
ncbi:MAG: bifunctional phosphopantothenoylcysteine decarboxylase/phosphopantothenate--cysteine ligase CoaBC [bacterium]